MKSSDITWEMVFCGLMLTGMAVLLVIQKPNPGPPENPVFATATFLSNPLPVGPSCDITPPTPPAPPVSVTSDLMESKMELEKHLMELKKLQHLKKLKHLKELDARQKQVLVIQSNSTD